MQGMDAEKKRGDKGNAALTGEDKKKQENEERIAEVEQQVYYMVRERISAGQRIVDVQ
jgi:hypothetical protein